MYNLPTVTLQLVKQLNFKSDGTTAIYLFFVIFSYVEFNMRDEYNTKNHT